MQIGLVLTAKEVRVFLLRKKNVRTLTFWGFSFRFESNSMWCACNTLLHFTIVNDHHSFWIFMMHLFIYAILHQCQVCYLHISDVYALQKLHPKCMRLHSFCVWDAEKKDEEKDGQCNTVKWERMKYFFYFSRLIDAMETRWHRNRILFCLSNGIENSNSLRAQRKYVMLTKQLWKIFFCTNNPTIN